MPFMMAHNRDAYAAGRQPGPLLLRQRETQTRPRSHRAARLLAPQTRTRRCRTRSIGERVRVRSRASVLDCASPLALQDRCQAPICALVDFTHAARRRRRTAALQDASRFTTPIAVLAR